MAVYMFLWSVCQRKDHLNKRVLYMNSEIIRILYIATMIAYLVDIYFNLQAFAIVSKSGYLYYYTYFTGYRSQFFLLQRIIDVSPFLFFFTIYFLEGRSRNILFTIYWLDAITGLMTGARNRFVLNSMIFIFYLAYESKIRGKNSVKKFRSFFYRILIILLVLSPLILSGMNYIGIIRMHGSLSQIDIYGLAKDALYEQGLSGLRLIDYVVDNENHLPEHKSFLLAPFRESFQKNIFAKALGYYKNYQPNTREYALNTVHLGNLFSLLNYRDYYLSGGGFGGSYIAEAYGDLGIFGVIIITILYSVIAFVLDRSSSLSPLQLTIGIQIFKKVLIAPRETALNFALIFFQPTFLVTLLLLFFIMRFKTSTKISGVTKHSEAMKHNVLP